MKKRIRIYSSIECSVDYIRTDMLRMKQILVNLLSNAVKFTPEGGEISLEIVDFTQQNLVRFSVRDTGIGIDEKDMALLFQPFVQIDGGLTRRYEGTGLGLSLVSRLVKILGGSISLESKVGKGTCFHVFMPLKSSECERRNKERM